MRGPACPSLCRRLAHTHPFLLQIHSHRCFEFVVPCSVIEGEKTGAASSGLDVTFTNANYQVRGEGATGRRGSTLSIDLQGLTLIRTSGCTQAHAGAFGGAVERLAAQGLCSRERAIIAL